MRSNNRSISLFEKWWNGQKGYDDQGWLNRHLGKEWLICTSAPTCTSYQRAGWFAAYQHPPYFHADHCVSGAALSFTDPNRACDTRRLYVHILCAGGYHAKNKTLEHWNLWLIGQDLKPIWSGSWGGGGGGGGAKHPFLPCAEDTAWPNVRAIMHNGGS